MNITVVTIRVPRNRAYDSTAARWLATYHRYKPTIPHELVVIDSDEAAPPGQWRNVASRFMVYTGGGWDCGAWQFAGREIKTDLLVCCNTSVYFLKHGWLDRIVAEVEKHGIGLYGPMASLLFHPHLRTPCLCFQPEVIQRYPRLITCRDKTYSFECLDGPENFTLWCAANGYPPRMVTWDGCYDLPDWRKPANVFWKGDQSDLLVKDRHAQRYDDSDPKERLYLQKQADGLT